MANLTTPIEINWDDIKSQLMKEGWAPVIRCEHCVFSHPVKAKDSMHLIYCDLYTKPIIHYNDFFCKSGIDKRDEVLNWEELNF